MPACVHAWCDKPAARLSQMCTLTCRMNGKGLQISKGVNSLENSNDLFSKQAWNGIFRNPFCLIPLPFSIPRVSKPAEYTVMQSLWPLQRKDWKPRDREFPCRELTFTLSFLSVSAQSSSRLSGWMLQLDSYGWSDPLQPCI